MKSYTYFLFIGALVIFLLFNSCGNNKRNNDSNYEFNLENFIKEFCNSTKSQIIYEKFSSIICLQDLYKKNNFKPIWFSEDTLNSKGKKALNQLTNSIAYGLDPDFYQVSAINFYIYKYTKGLSYYKEWAKVMTELLLTDSYLLFCHHLMMGWSNQSVLANDIAACSLNSEILPLINSEKFDEIIENIEFKLVHYKNYRKAWTKFYTSLQSFNNDSIPFVAQDSILAYEKATNKFVSLNLLSKSDEANILKIRNAIRRYQYLFGIQENGVLDSNTIKSLNTNFEDYCNRSVAVIEKLKHLDAQKDNFVLINIPTYTLFWVELGELAATHKVVVGTFKNQTPELESTISKFTLFPEWNVPYKIATKEILPCVKNNVKYLTKHKYVISSGTGTEVDPSTVNWKKLNNSNFPYRVKQTSGEHNSLGILKFYFSNSNDVYLHDTPQKNFFNRTIRSFSHGCMRLHNPFDFLKLVLEYQAGISHLSEERQKELNIYERQKIKFKKILEGKENVPMIDTVDVHLKNRVKKDFFLKKSIPIYVTYFSSFYDFEGNVLFYPDVYKRDTVYSKALIEYRLKQNSKWN